MNAREKVDRAKPEWNGKYKLMWVDKEGDQVRNFFRHDFFKWLKVNWEKPISEFLKRSFNSLFLWMTS